MRQNMHKSKLLLLAVLLRLQVVTSTCSLTTCSLRGDAVRVQFQSCTPNLQPQWRLDLADVFWCLGHQLLSRCGRSATLSCCFVLSSLMTKWNNKTSPLQGKGKQQQVESEQHDQTIQHLFWGTSLKPLVLLFVAEDDDSHCCQVNNKQQQLGSILYLFNPSRQCPKFCSGLCRKVR